MRVGNFIFSLSQGTRGTWAVLFIAVLSAACMSGDEGDSLRFESLIGIQRKNPLGNELFAIICRFGFITRRQI